MPPGVKVLLCPNKTLMSLKQSVVSDSRAGCFQHDVSRITLYSPFLPLLCVAVYLASLLQPPSVSAGYSYLAHWADDL